MAFSTSFPEFSLLPSERSKREKPRTRLWLCFIIIYFFTMILFTTCGFWFGENRNCEETKNDEKHGTLQNEKRMKWINIKYARKWPWKRTSIYLGESVVSVSSLYVAVSDFVVLVHIREKLLWCHCKGLATVQELPNLLQTREGLIFKEFCHSFAVVTRSGAPASADHYIHSRIVRRGPWRQNRGFQTSLPASLL